MTPDRYRQIGDLYHAALEVEAGERAALLETACAGDAELRREVESLIASHDEGVDFIASPALALAAKHVAARDTDELVGQMIARYRVLSPIGAGGMGCVYLAEDAELGRRVALKLLPEYFTHDQSRVRRFRQEARAASALNHPNIVTIHEIGQTDSGHFIATEFIDGETLRDHLAITKMTTSAMLDVAAQVASALQAAHEAGIVHRDVKPDNIMLRPDGIAKVLDFGLAKLALHQVAAVAAASQITITTNPGLVMGTVGYMSPEQARGFEVDARTDIWSLGVVLYEMLTGRSPFAGETASDTVAAILKTEPAPLARYAPQLPDELQRIVHRCLEKNCEQRYQSAKDLFVDLRQLQKRLEVGDEIRRSAEPNISTAAPNKADAMPADAIAVPTNILPFINYIARRKLIAFGVVALFITGISLFTYRHWPAGDTSINSLAVMPFVNEGQDPQAEYLSDGITESLISNLSQLANLKVMSRNSVFRFKGQTVDARQAAQVLGVGAVMMGNLKRIDDQLVINVELIDARDGSVIWTRQYVRKMVDVIALQTNVAQDIAGNLRLRLSGAQQQQLTKRPTGNVEAYELYLKGRYFWNNRRPDDLRKSVECFQRAIDLDPNFALAYAGLADCYNSQVLYSEVPPGEAIPKAKAAAIKAFELDDTLSEAHAALGWSKMAYDRDWNGAEREFQRAIEVNPNYSLGHSFYAGLLMARGQFDEAIVKRKAALELDPLSTNIMTAFGWTFYFHRQYDSAIAECRETLVIDENFFRARLYIGMAYEQKGMYEQSIDELKKALSVSENNVEILSSMAHVYATSGNRAEALQILRKVNDLPKQKYVDPYFVALIYLGLGQKDQAFEWLEKAYDHSSMMLNFLNVEPRLDSIRSDPRFQQFVRRVGLPQ